MKKYVLLDRDGVINHDSEDFIKSPEEWLPIAGSLEAIALLKKHHFYVVVITNQSGLARGLFDEKTLNAIHEKMQNLVARNGGKIDAIYFCPHDANANCSCRKPKAGLLTQFSIENHVDLTDIFFIGDSLRDIQAARNGGAKPILVKTGNGNKTLCDNPQLLKEISIFNNLYDAANFIIRESS